MSLEKTHTPRPSRTATTVPDINAGLSGLRPPQHESDAPTCTASPGSESPSTKQRFWGAFRVIEREEFKGSNRTLTALNRGLSRAWDQASPVVWILARVRCEILKLSPGEYAAAHGLLSHSTLAGLEEYRPLKRARFNPETIHRLLKGWEKLARKHKAADPRVAEMLKEAKGELLRVLTRKRGCSVYGVLARWRYEVGPKRFDKQSGYSYQAMWQRQKSGTMFDFGELLRIGRSLGFIKAREHPPKLWKNARVRELESAWMFDSRKLGRPKEVSRLYKIVEACGLKVDKETLHGDPRIKLRLVVVEALNRFQSVPWKKIQPLFRELHARKAITQSEYRSIRSSWRKSWAGRPETFERRLSNIRDARGLTNVQLADAVGLTELDPKKPSLQVFRALSYGDKSKHASFGVLAHLIGRSNEEVDSLLEQKRGEILAQWRRQGSAISSDVAVERALWCLEYPEVPYDKSELQKLEWGKPSELNPDDVVAGIRAIGKARVTAALKCLRARRDLYTVQGAIGNLIGLRGYAPLADLMETSVPVLKRIENGSQVPTYPKLAGFLRLLGREPSAELEADWRNQFARRLVADNQGDLQRILNAYVAEHGTSRRALLRDKGHSSSDVARIFHWVGEAGVAEPEQLAQVLDCLGMSLDHPTRLFVECVGNVGTIERALPLWLERMEQDRDHSEVRQKLSRAVSASKRPVNRARSIGELRKQILSAENATVAASSSSDTFEVLRLLPGVTCAEIAQALDPSRAREAALMESYKEHALSKGLSHRDLIYALREMVPSERRPLSLLERAVQLAVPSAACPLGVLAYLTTQSLDEAEREVAHIREELGRRLKKFEIPGHDAVVEMGLWGIRPDDLGLASKVYAQQIWERSADDADSAQTHTDPASSTEGAVVVENSEAGSEIVTRARDLGLYKARVALQKLIHRRTAVVPWQLVKIAVQSIQGEDRAYSQRGGFRLGAAAQFISQSSMPTPSQLRRTVELAELNVTKRMELEWSDSYARFLRREKTALLGRVLLCRIVSREFDVGAPVESAGSRTLIGSIVNKFLRSSGLSVITYGRVIHQACTGEPVTPEHLQEMGKALGYKANSPGMMLLRSLAEC